jgi:MtN3 and saliva related transmembrane protein
MTFLDAIGYLAALCTTAAYLPQVVKAWRSQSTRDLSTGMLVVLNTGLALWLAYGIGKNDAPLIIANAVTLALAGTVLVLKLRHG